MADRTCVGCGGFLAQPGRGRPRKWCSEKCAAARGGHFKRTYTPKGGSPETRECTQCGETFQSQSGRRYCSDLCKHRRAWELRQERRPTRPPTPPMPGCVRCGSMVSKRTAYRCGPCGRAEQSSFHRAISNHDANSNLRRRWTKRNRLDNAAPGPYNRRRRNELLTLWRKQGRRCAYCLVGPAEQVDHIIPLSRGGTNFEGNLVPACSKCNYEKWGNLLAAWRYGINAKRPPMTWIDTEPGERRRKSPKVWIEVPLFAGICAGCDVPVGPRAEFCSSRCNARVAYRRKVGIPDKAPAHSIRQGQPTKRQEAA